MRRGLGDATRTILIVEDDDDIRFTVQELLEGEGYSVRTAADGQAALDALASHADVGLIILDKMMPRMDGEEFVREVRKDRAAPVSRIPILLLTADGNAAESLARRVDGFVRKPIELEPFLALIRTLLESRVVERRASG